MAVFDIEPGVSHFDYQLAARNPDARGIEARVVICDKSFATKTARAPAGAEASAHTPHLLMEEFSQADSTRAGEQTLKQPTDAVVTAVRTVRAIEPRRGCRLHVGSDPLAIECSPPRCRLRWSTTITRSSAPGSFRGRGAGIGVCGANGRPSGFFYPGLSRVRHARNRTSRSCLVLTHPRRNDAATTTGGGTPCRTSRQVPKTRIASTRTGARRGRAGSSSCWGCMHDGAYPARVHLERSPRRLSTEWRSS